MNFFFSYDLPPTPLPTSQKTSWQFTDNLFPEPHHLHHLIDGPQTWPVQKRKFQTTKAATGKKSRKESVLRWMEVNYLAGAIVIRVGKGPKRLNWLRPNAKVQSAQEKKEGDGKKQNSSLIFLVASFVVLCFMQPAGLLQAQGRDRPTRPGCTSPSCWCGLSANNQRWMWVICAQLEASLSQHKYLL